MDYNINNDIIINYNDDVKLVLFDTNNNYKKMLRYGNNVPSYFKVIHATTYLNNLKKKYTLNKKE